MEKCTQCDGEEHVIDNTMFDRICVSCGLVSSVYIEMVDWRYEEEKRDSQKNHFTTLFRKFAPSNKNIRNEDIDFLYTQFNQLLRRFYETKHLHGRKYMNYRYMIYKLMIKYDMKDKIPANLKMPKGAKTLVNLEKLWNILND